MQRIIAMHGVSAEGESFRAQRRRGTFVDPPPADPRTDALAGSDRRADRGSTLLRRNETGRTGLIEAYKRSAALVLENAEIEQRTVDVQTTIRFSYLGHERCDAHRQGIAAADYRTTIRQPLHDDPRDPAGLCSTVARPALQGGGPRTGNRRSIKQHKGYGKEKPGIDQRLFTRRNTQDHGACRGLRSRSAPTGACRQSYRIALL